MRTKVIAIDKNEISPSWMRRLYGDVKLSSLFHGVAGFFVGSLGAALEHAHEVFQEIQEFSFYSPGLVCSLLSLVLGRIIAAEVREKDVFIEQSLSLREDLKKESLEKDVLLRQQLALNKANRAIMEGLSFKETARIIFDELSLLIGSTAGYVALMSKDGMANEVLFLEAGGRMCKVDPSLPMSIRGLRELAYWLNKPVFDNDFMNSKWLEFMPAGYVFLDNVMFVPIIVKGNTVGVIGLANKLGDFTEEDTKIGLEFGNQTAIALERSKTLDLIVQREAELQELVRCVSKFVHIFKMEPNGELNFFGEGIQELTGYSRGDILTRRIRWIDMVVPEDKKSYREAVKRDRGNSEHFYERQYRIYTKSGSLKWVYESGKVFGEDKEIESPHGKKSIERGIHFEGIVFDMTYRKALDDLARVSELRSKKVELISTFAGGLAHDFNNLLMIIMGNNEQLQNGKLADDQKLECLADIKYACEQVDESIKRFNRLGKPVMSEVPDKVTLNKIIKQKIDKFLKTIKPKIDLKFLLKEDDFFALTNENLVEVILTGILQNAHEAIQMKGDIPGQQITVTSEIVKISSSDVIRNSEFEPGLYQKISISDTGVGIPEELKEKIFDPMFSTKERSTQKLMGLSLSEVLIFVRQFGGIIEFTSEVGKGTNFDIYFKAVQKTLEEKIMSAEIQL